MSNQNSSTFIRDAQKAIATKQSTVGFVTLLDWTEYQQALVKASDSNQANRQWLAAHGLSDVNPSEIFAA